jgi:Fe-S cluster assembly protein SufD
MATLTREQARTRFDELPLPSTADEHWRFTDLRGFDPAPVSDTKVSDTSPALDLDVAGRALVTENGIEIVDAPEGITFEPLARDYEAKLIPDDDKFALENLARWEHGLLVHVPKGVVLEKPLYVQVTSSGGSLFWRMVVIADEGARFTLIEDLGSASDDTVAYTNAVVELFVDPQAKIEYVSLQNLSKETWHFGRHKAWLERDSELDWVIGGFGSKRGKVWIENDLAGPGATSRVTGAYFADGDQHLDYDTFQEHIAPNTESDFAFKGALRENATAVWRGMIRVEEGAQKTNAYQENRNLLLSDKAHADSIPGL